MCRIGPAITYIVLYLMFIIENMIISKKYFTMETSTFSKPNSLLTSSPSFYWGQHVASHALGTPYFRIDVIYCG